MTSELRNEAPTFKDVARLIAEEEGDVEWLADGLRSWIWPQERWPQAARKRGHGLGMFADMVRVRWSRARLHKALKVTLPSAADTLTDLLADWALFSFLTDERLGPGFGPLDRVALGNLLHEIRRRCRQASQFPDLVSEDGKPKAGRNRALAPGQIDEKVACASAIAAAWRFTRGKPLGPRVRRAAKAADLLFDLGMAPAGRFDLVETRRGWGADPLNAWPPYFKAALAPNPVLDRMNAMLTEALHFARESSCRRFEIPDFSRRDGTKSRPEVTQFSSVARPK
jgi:hypothetical protein